MVTWNILHDGTQTTIKILDEFWTDAGVNALIEPNLQQTKSWISMLGQTAEPVNLDYGLVSV